MAVMAMFPLGTVLLPGGVLPLQVFEPRYRAMVGDLLADSVDHPEFGVVLIERGREVGGGDQRANLGTVARITQIAALPGDRYGLVAVGTERFRVVAWLPDDPYPLADVEVLNEAPFDPSEGLAAERAVERLHRRVQNLNEQVRALGDMAPPPDAEISDDPSLGVYHLGSLAPLGPADRQRMLDAATFWERVEVLGSALDDAEAIVQFRSS